MTKNRLFDTFRSYIPPDTPRPRNALAGAGTPIGLRSGSTLLDGGYRTHKPEETTLFGKGGHAYSIEIYPINADLPAVPGVYALATETRGASLLFGRRFAPQYIGEALSIAERVIPSHSKMEPAKRLGATHVLIWRAPDSQTATRETVETDLRHYYDPPLNRQGLSGVF